MSGRNWAIAIGINNYQNLQPLEYARGDAEALQNYFLHEVGFEKVYYFSEKSPAIEQDYGAPIESRPTYAVLRRFLRVRFEKPFLGAGDNFWFFFAGHGIREGDRDYLMPIDADPGDVENTAISLHYIRERLLRSGADNVVLLLDACRNEGRRSVLGVGGSRYPGIVTFYSCSPRESSYEIKELQQGAFTHVLLQGLRIQGEGNCATVERLSRYLQSRVPALVGHYKKRLQTPVAAVDPASKYHLILLPKLATVADTNVLRVDAFAAEQKGDYRRAKELWIRVLVNAPGDSQAIEAIEHLASSRPKPKPSGTGNNSGRRSGIPTILTRRQWLQLAGFTGMGATSALVIKAISEWKPPAPTPHQPTPSPSPTPKPSIIEPVASPQSVEESNNTLSEFEFETVMVNDKGEEKERKEGKAKFFAEDLGNGVAIDMVSIPGGSFLMGTEDAEIERLQNKYNRPNWFGDESPQHKVQIEPFFMGKTPITQAQWREVVTQVEKIERDLRPDPASFVRFKGDKRPVENVSWFDAIEFCARLSKLTGQNYRLPSEAEWEYACRAGTKTPFHFGETITTDLANYCGQDREIGETLYPGTFANEPQGKYREETTPVDEFIYPNAFGLYDMHGNVWEWCLDPWHENYEGAPTDGKVWDENDNDYQNLSQNLKKLLNQNIYTSLRGGSWGNNPDNCRASNRDYNSRDFHYYIGFRVVFSRVAGL